MAKSKMSTTTLVCTIAMAVGALLAIVGLFVNWANVTVEILGQSATEGGKLFDLEGTWGVMAIIFAILTVVSGIGAVACSLLKTFGKVKLNDKICLIVGIVVAACAVVALVCTFIFGGQYSETSELASATVSPAIGAWLLTVGGIACGTACIANK